MKLLGVNLEGRLGNQLFQYAYIFALAKEKNALWFIDQSKYNFFPVKYFTLPSYKAFLNAVFFKLYLNFPKAFTEVNEDGIGTIPDNKLMLFKGYFQSSRYFADYSKEIRREFEVKQEYKNAFTQKYGTLYANNKTIGIHIRKTDIVNFGFRRGDPKDASMPVSYYLECFKQIENLNSYKLVFATDDVSFVKEHFAHLPNAVIEVNDEITDLQVLINADIVITANSSFSWWGAWLNTKANKKVFSPKHWMGTHKGELFPKEIFEQLDWIQV